MDKESDNGTEKVTLDQYGRKLWNVEAYAREAKNHKKPQETVVHGDVIPEQSTSYISHRDKLLKELLAAIKTYNIINPLSSISSHGKDRKFGFSCPVCNLSFRDNMALIDHLNSPQHIAKTQDESKRAGSDEKSEELLEGGIARASYEEVVATIEALVKQLIRKKSQVLGHGQLSFKERVDRRRAFEDKKRRKRKERKVQKKVQSEEEDEIAAAMGISGFGTTKR